MGEAGKDKHDPFEALQLPAYRRFLGGWCFASIGMQMQAMALAWELYERTRDVTVLGTVGLCRALPVIALALPAGQIVDWFSRKKLLVLTQLAFAAVSLLLAWASYVQAPVIAIYGLIVLSGCARVFNGPTRSSILPMIVPGPAFRNAVTWNSGVFHASAMLGPLIGGQIIDHVMPYWGMPMTPARAWPVYVVTGMGCLVFAVSMMTVKVVEPVRDRSTASVSGLLLGMFAGARHMWREKTVLGAIALDLFAVLLGGATALLPVYTKEILHGDATMLGVLRAAPYCGAVAMAIALAFRKPFTRNGPILLWSVAGFGLATVVFGLSRNVWLSMAALVVAGAVDNISVVIRHVLVQMRTPDELRGRVSAVNSVFIESSNELGAFESAAVARVAGTWLGANGVANVAAGAVFSAVSGGVGTVLVVLGIAWWLPELRKLGRLDEEHASPTKVPAAAPGVDAQEPVP